jgi:hypothetical protein
MKPIKGQIHTKSRPIETVERKFEGRLCEGDEMIKPRTWTRRVCSLLQWSHRPAPISSPR